VLPVELVHLEAVAVSNAVEVRWRTATELNNDRFEVERSFDGDEFVFVGEVDGAGTTNEATSYQVIDHHARHGLNYYRLKQFDTDGHFDHSHVVSAFMANNDGPPVLYPSPGSEEAYLFLPEGFADALFMMIDGTGRVVLERTLRTGGNTIDTRILPRAPYAYLIHDANATVVARGTWLKY
jgi:hypothetical protein